MPAMTTQGHGWDARPEIEHYLQVHKDLEQDHVSTEGFEDRSSAEREIAEARRSADTSNA
jgi:inorganic pyrophosphatase